MNVRDPPLHELADKNVGAFADRLRYAVDLPALGVSPPTTSDLLASNRFGQAWNAALGGLEDDSMLLDKGKGFFRAHHRKWSVAVSEPCLPDRM